MRAVSLILLLVSDVTCAVQFVDPRIYCETRTASIVTASYSHCKEGDLIQVEAFEVKTLCNLMSPVVAVGSEHLCAYRGEARTTRRRPLTAVEEAYRKEQVDSAMEKYGPRRR